MSFPSLLMGYWGDGAQRTYHHTAPVNTLYGLHESLVMMLEEGLENSWTRHQKNHVCALIKANWRNTRHC
jgi:alanine-glyoxylate transaminase/serine-glyoxylate transaminase/serine-pyruvate transaminase